MIWFFLGNLSAHDTSGSANSTRTFVSDNDDFLSTTTPVMDAPATLTAPVVEGG